MTRLEKRMRQRNQLPLHRHTFIFLLFTALLGGALLTPSSFERAKAQQSPQTDAAIQLGDSALSQIAAFTQEKRSRTAAQKKIDSNLLATLRMSRGESVAPGVQTIQTDVDIDAQRKILIDIDATVTNKLLNRIKRLGGDVINSFPQYRAIRANFPLSQLEDLAALPEVNFINRAIKSETNGVPTPRSRRQRPAKSLLNHPFDNFSIRAANVRAQLLGAMSGSVTANTVAPQDLTPDTGSVTSQGDVTHRAAAARTTFATTGAGVKIGVLSTSDDFREASQASGDLPPVVTVVAGQSGRPDSGEGTAMMEIVHDLAPGAQLFFATGLGSTANFANNIITLRNLGCDIIVDDISYFNESPFQDAVIAQAVNTVTASGALFFSSAANSGNLNDGQSGVWEGDFVDGGPFSFPAGNLLGNVHIFGGFNNNLVTTGGSSYKINLFWSDPLGASANDYDVYIFNNAGSSILRYSNSEQSGTQDPYETIDTLNVGERIVVIRFSGAARFIHLDTNRGRLASATAGQTRGHSAAVDSFSVAAVDVATSFPNAYAGGVQNPVETTSSDGPRRVFYNANGTAITPGNVSSTGGALRQKPDIAAADGNVTTLPPGSGLNPFFGTSAAAPHAAAIAALIKSYRPSLTPAQIRATLINTALDIEAPGVDRDSGAGIVMAYQALQSLGTTSTPKPPSDFDGDGRSDIAVYRSTNGGWYVQYSSNSTVNSLAFGAPGDIAAPGDYDGDGKADQAVFRPSTGYWYLMRSTLGFAAQQFGQNLDIPAAGDYDGDGKTDIAVFRPSTGSFYIQRSSLGFTGVAFGTNGDKPVVGDYDGDGKADVAVYRAPTGSWYMLRSTAGFLGVAFGAVGDLPAQGDYDGDGKTDQAVFRPSNGAWYVNGSQAGFNSTIFGQNGDKPAPGDFDGDGKTDRAVFRPSVGSWYILRSTAGFYGQQFGANGDLPVPAGYIPQ